MTLKEMKMYIDGFRETQLEEHEFNLMFQDRINFMLGQYITMGFHEPRKYPLQPFTSDNMQKRIENEKEMTPDQFVVSLQAWMGSLGAKEVTYE